MHARIYHIDAARNDDLAKLDVNWDFLAALWSTACDEGLYGRLDRA